MSKQFIKRLLYHCETKKEFKRHLTTAIFKDKTKTDKLIEIEIFKANPDKPWNLREILCNPNLTIEIIKANPDKPWNWRAISCNPNITMEMINANPDILGIGSGFLVIQI